MFEILVIAAIAGLAVLTGVKCKAAGNIALGLLTVITYICYGIFILGIAAAVIGTIGWFISEHF